MSFSIAVNAAVHAALPPGAGNKPDSLGLAEDKSEPWQAGLFRSVGGLFPETEYECLLYNGHAGLGANLHADAASAWCSVDTNFGLAQVVATQAAETGN